MLCAKSPKGLRSLLRLGDCLLRCCHSSKRFNFDCIRFVVALVFGYPFPRMFAQLFDKFTGSPSQDPLPPALTSQQPSIPASLACAFGRFSQSSGGPEKRKRINYLGFYVRVKEVADWMSAFGFPPGSGSCSRACSSILRPNECNWGWKCFQSFRNELISFTILLLSFYFGV